jgi:uncharacterized RDD family membrane protein YckC
MSDPQILDTPITGDNTLYNAKDHLASTGIRFLNLIVDTAIYYGLAVVVGFILGMTGNVRAATDPLSANLIAITLILSYYTIMEASFGATVGKLVTKTRVVTELGEKPGFGQIVGRSFSRLIPFEAFSFLGGNPGWHDTITSTFVVKKED